MRIRLLLLLGFAAIGLARAEETIVAPDMGAAALSVEEKQMLQERSKALHEKADLMREGAEATFTAENNACWQKFLVSSCQNDAKKARTARLIEARRIQQEARAIDEKLRKANFAENQATKAAEDPKRAADAAEQAEKNRKAQQEAIERVEKKRQEAEQRAKH